MVSIGFDLPVLVTTASGSEGDLIESLPEEEVTERVMEVLRKMYGSDIPQPSRVLVTNWRKDPYSLGAYSYLPVGASDEDYQLLAKPVARKVYFAGEATSALFPASMHGAMMSGIREARRIKRHLRSKV